MELQIEPTRDGKHLYHLAMNLQFLRNRPRIFDCYQGTETVN